MQFILLYVLILKLLGRLALNSSECIIYIDKLYRIKKILPELIIDERSIRISFGYFDQLFDNDTFWGLTPEDGKEVNSTCLDLKIYTFSNLHYDIIDELQNLTYRFDSSTQFRYINVILDLETQTQMTYSSKFYDHKVGILLCYTGNQSTQIGNEQIQVFKTQLSQFSFRIDRQVSNDLITNFNQIDAIKRLSFCKVITCNQTFDSLPILVGQNFILIFRDIQYQYKNLSSQVFLIGEGLQREVNSIIVNSSAQQAILLISSDIVWNSCQIKVELLYSDSTVFSNQSKMTETLEIDCIQLNSTSGCPTCIDECSINQGIVEKQCPQCQSKLTIDSLRFFILIFINQFI